MPFAEYLLLPVLMAGLEVTLYTGLDLPPPTPASFVPPVAPVLSLSVRSYRIDFERNREAVSVLDRYVELVPPL